MRFTILLLGSVGLHAQAPCPSINFARTPQANFYQASTQTGGGLIRNPDGSFTEHRYRITSPYPKQGTTANAQSKLFSCAGFPQRSLPSANLPGFNHPLGLGSRNPLVLDTIPGNTIFTYVRANANAINVIPANPDFTTGTPVTLAVTRSPRSVLSADFDGDGRRDLAVFSWGLSNSNGAASIFLANTNGTLRIGPVANLQYGANAGAAFDFNADGRVDLAVVSLFGSKVDVLLGNGDGSFGLPVSYSLAGSPEGIVVADVTGDSKADLIITIPQAGVVVLPGNGNGTFGAAITTPARGRLISLAAGDFNKDGKLDVAGIGDGELGVMLGNGNGTFTAGLRYMINSENGDVPSAWLTDLDSDGNVDLLVAGGHPQALAPSINDGSMSVLFGRGDGSFEGIPLHSPPPIGNLNEFATGDFTGDGKPDVVITTRTNGETVLYLLTGQSSETLQSPVMIPNTAYRAIAFSSIAAGDVNGDNKPDIIAAESSFDSSGNYTSAVWVIAGNNNGTFQTPVRYPVQARSSRLAIGDVNSDGKNDIVVAHGDESGFIQGDPKGVSILLANANGTLQNATFVPTGDRPRQVLLDDINGDGRVDIIVVHAGDAGNPATAPGGIAVLNGNGNGTFGQPVTYQATNPSYAAIADVNGDGRKDVVATTGGLNFTYNVAVFLGNSNGALNAALNIPTASGPSSVSIADFNKDNKPDLFVTYCCGQTDAAWFAGNGNGTFQPEVHIPVAPSTQRAAPVDMNGDGFTDIVMRNLGPLNSVSILLNVSGAANTTSVRIDTNPTGLSIQVDGISYTAPQTFQWTPSSSHTIATTGSQSLSAGTRHQFTSWSDGGGLSHTVSPSASTSYTAAFTTQYLLTLSSNPANSGSISAQPQSGDGYYAAGSAVQVTATPSSGCVLLGFGGELLAQTSPQNLVMNSPRQVSANFSCTGPPPQQSGWRFVSMAPCRIMETRPEYNFEGRTGAFGPPFLPAGTTRTLPMTTSNVCSVPTAAKAFVVNVTLIPRGGVDFVTVFPAGETRPDVWTVRSADGQIVANSAIVKAGTGNAISVHTSHDADFLIDISGYFTDNTALSNLAFYPLTPCRVIDTRIVYRSPPGPFGPPTMSARETRRFRFPSTPYCSLPSGAAAYAITLTVVPPQPLPYLTVWPAGASQPNVSSINSFAGRVLANNLIVPASADGSIDVFALERTDFLIDITGVFAPDNGSGLYYTPVTQCRVSDTRGNGFSGAFGGPVMESQATRTIPIPAAPTCTGVPGAARAYALSATAIPNGSPTPFLTAWGSGGPRPNVSMLNAFEGQTVTGSAIIPAGVNGAIDVFTLGRTHVVIDLAGYFSRTQ